MNLKWFKGLGDTSSAELKIQLKESRLVLERLDELLEQERIDIHKKIETKYSIDDHRLSVGSLRTITAVQKLIRG